MALDFERFDIDPRPFQAHWTPDALTTHRVLDSALNVAGHHVVDVRIDLANTDAEGEFIFEESADGTNWDVISFRDGNDVKQASRAVAAAEDVNQSFLVPLTGKPYFQVRWAHSAGSSSANIAVLRITVKSFAPIVVADSQD